jgi:hypothetical protein
MANLYSFTSSNCENAGAPKLTPVGSSSIASGSSNYISQSSGSSSTIDVVNAFQWTTSPPGTQSRQEVPGIELIEKRLRTNSIIAAAAYYLMSGTSSLSNILSQVSNIPGAGSAVSSIQSVINSLVSNPGVSNLGSGLSNFLSNTLTSSSLGYSVNNSSLDNLFTNGSIQGLNSNYLEPYEGLYLTEDTGFKYYLPYFTDSLQQAVNNFEKEDATFNENTWMGWGVNKVRKAAEAIARFSYWMEPGIYIERPKFYAFEGNGDEIDVKFPLVNTGWSTHDDVRRNWQFVFLLTYQNRPNRRSRELIDPACIYEVNIPGVKYLPYAFIKSLSIDCLGARRLMDLEVPTPGGSSTISTIVPDAYNITIKLEGLVPTSRNFLAAMLSDKQDIINVTSYNTYNLFGEIWDSLTGLGTGKVI